MLWVDFWNLPWKLVAGLRHQICNHLSGPGGQFWTIILHFLVTFGIILDHSGVIFSQVGPLRDHLGATGHPRWALFGIVSDFGANPGQRPSPKMIHFWGIFRDFVICWRFFGGLFFCSLLEPPLGGSKWLPIGKYHIRIRFPMSAKSDILGHFWVTVWYHFDKFWHMLVILGHKSGYQKKVG